MNSKTNKWLAALAIAALVAPTALQPIAQAASGSSSRAAGANLPFNDISSLAAEQRTSILQAVEAGLLHGDPAGSYRPTDLLTRQEMAVLLTQALHLPVSKAAKSSFSDVNAKSWSSPYIEAVHRAGLMNGDGSLKFRPKAAVTREEAAVLLMRAAGLTVTVEATESAKLTDWSRVSSWARPYVNLALQSGSMAAEQNVFKPGSPVQRQDIARFLMATFFPENHLAQLQKVEDGKVLINGIEYRLADSVKGILQASNQDVLKGAEIQFEASKGTVQSISKLVIHASGRAASGQASEFSGNLVLEGHDAVVNGDLIVDGDYISIRNLNVKRDLTITKNLGHDFYASKLTVLGKTSIQGGDQDTVLFDGSELSHVEVSKQDVHVVTQGSSNVANMTLTSNATIENDSSSALKQVSILSGAQQVKLQGNIQQLSVNSDQPLTLTGQASINTMVVNNASPITLGVSGTVSNLQVNNPSANISVSSSSQIVNTSLAQGVSSATVTGSPSASGTTSGASQGSSTPVVTNTAPVLKTKYSDQAMTTGEPELLVDLLGHFVDAEQSVLKYTAVSSSSSICSVRLEGTDLYIKAVGKGTATITIAADDQAGKKAGTSFKVRVNEPPVSSSIPAQTKQLGSGDLTLSLGAFFTDSENDPLTYEAAINDPSIATFTLVGDQLVITPIKTGQAQVTVKASDGWGGITNQPFQLEVTSAANRDPVVNQKPANQLITVGDADYILDLSQVFLDPDGDPVHITAESSNSSVATVSVNGNQAVVHALSSGTAKITLKGSDGGGNEASTDFDITVNEPPTTVVIPNQTKEINTGDIQLSLNQYFSDPDSDTLTYSVQEISDPNVMKAAVNGDVLTLTPLMTGSTSVSVKAADGRGGETVVSFQAVVTDQAKLNQSPVEIQPADKTLTVGDPVYSLDLGSVFTDPDGDPLTYEASSSDSLVATAEVDGAQLKIQALKAGTATIGVKAVDGHGGEASTSFKINVQSAGSSTPSSNHPPEVQASIYEQVLTTGVTNPRTYDLTQLFSDADGDAMTFTAVSESGSVVNAAVHSGMLDLTPGTQAGSTKVTITADDGNGGTAAYDFRVTNAPLATNGIVQIRTKQGVNDPITYDLSTVFPGETSFKVYSGTADSTFVGPIPLNGTMWTWNGDPLQYYWVIGANGTAAVFQVSASPQGPEELYFSQYMSLDKTRTAIELFYNPVGDTSVPIENAGYSLEVHQYNTATGTPKIWSQPIDKFYKGMPFIFIDPIFYDFFDLVNVAYYNVELGTDPRGLAQTNTNVTTGYVLKKNGVTMDVLGDPDGKTQFMPNDGTIIRKSGIRTGSSSYSLAGEWNSFPKGTIQYFGRHTP
ncbi:S-layer homology domain-containing protein [Paenibacillus tuaregi]|uniref:S-layer homology domain-containing protein n=1 Tax=Paenibacillus tuaregi TaxID=1816681 RepID=UPI00083967E7|nr:S-layer homology domain-containing protein [Paenibacillus tuaregi]